jgi:hypothetical protein
MCFLCSVKRFVGSAPKVSFFVWIVAIATAAGQTATQVTIPAKEADQFVGSMGVNVHMESKVGPYSKRHYAQINSLLQALSMRHFRDEMNAADASFAGPVLSRDFIDEVQSIGALGYSLDGVIEGGNDYPPHNNRLEACKVVPMIQSLLPTIETVEGPNEPDDGYPDNDTFLYHGLKYPQGAINESVDLWNIVKNSSTDFPGPSISALPVVVMSEGYAPDFSVLAAAWLADNNPLPFSDATYGNMHAYQGGGVGDQGLTGSKGYIRYSRELTGRDDLWTTEMGYHNNTYYLADREQQGVSERAAAIYLPAAFLAGFDHGVVRTFSYELINETKEPPLADCPSSTNPTNPRCEGYGYYGLLNYDRSVKPAFTALTNLTQILREPGATFEPGSLTMTFSADAGPNPYKPEYVLLEKSDGDYYLAIWNDIQVFKLATCKKLNEKKHCIEPVAGKDIPTENIPVTITFSVAESFTVYAPNDPSGTNPTGAYTLSTTSNSIEVDLPPEVLIIKIASSSA